MTYDFFVFPADRADDLPQALAAYEGTAETAPLTCEGDVGRFVADLNRASPVHATDGFLRVAADGTDEGAVVSTSWDDPMGNLSRVAGLARPLGLAVLDVQMGELYDPRRAVDVSLQTEAGPQLPFLTRSILREVMSQIKEGRYHWVNLSRENDSFAQSFHDDDGSWAVEHREARGRRHFAARTTDDTLVDGLLWSWARGDGRWQAMLAFSPIEL